MRYIIILLSFFIIGISGNAQDTITFLNGRVITGKVITTDSTYTVINFKKKRKVIEKAYANELIFCIQSDSGLADTIYTPDNEYDLYLSKKDMGLFILGEQDAKAYYKTPLTSILGVAVSGSLGYALHDGFWVAAVPLVYTIGAGLTPARIKAPDHRSLDVLQSSAYQEGYLKVARTKKGFNALLSSVIGTFAGALIGHANN